MRKTPSHTRDNIDQIRTCLSCPYPSCWGGCSLVGNGPKRARGSKLDRGGIGRELTALGLTDEQIAVKVGMSTKSVYLWRKRNGITAGRFTRKKETEK